MDQFSKTGFINCIAERFERITQAMIDSKHIHGIRNSKY
jgi:hypothetical protein